MSQSLGQKQHNFFAAHVVQDKVSAICDVCYREYQESAGSGRLADYEVSHNWFLHRE